MNTQQQLALDLSARPALGRDDFFVTEANRLAMEKIEAWERWPGAMLMVTGPRGSGKSHLVAVWAALAGADLTDPGCLDGTGPLAVDGVDGAAGNPALEEALFHFFNRARTAGQPVLFTGRTAPGEAGFRLPDLVSRLQSLDTARLSPPDDALLAAMLTKQLSDRQVEVAPKVVDYLVPRMERTFDAVQELAAALNRASYAERRPPSIPMARAVLEALSG